MDGADVNLCGSPVTSDGEIFDDAADDRQHLVTRDEEGGDVDARRDSDVEDKNSRLAGCEGKVWTGLYALLLTVAGFVISVTQIFMEHVTNATKNGFDVCLLGGGIISLIVLFVLPTRTKVEQNPHAGSLYLKFGAVLFGLGSAMDAVIDIIDRVWKEDIGVGVAESVLRFLFIITMIGYLLNYVDTVYLEYKWLVNLSVMHLVATSLCAWVDVLIHETAEDLKGADTREMEVTMWLNPKWVHSIDAFVISGNVSPTTQVTEIMLTKEEAKNGIFEPLIEQATPFLYPCTVEFNLIVAGFLYIIWSSVGKAPQHDTVPRQYDTVPPQQDTVPRQHDTVPRQHDTVPRQQDTVPRQHDTVPPQQDTVPRQHDTVPPQQDTVPPQHDTVPCQHDTVPPQQDTVPRQHDTVPRQHDTVPPQHDTVPCQHDTVPPQQDTMPRQHDTAKKDHASDKRAAVFEGIDCSNSTFGFVLGIWVLMCAVAAIVIFMGHDENKTLNYEMRNVALVLYQTMHVVTSASMCVALVVVFCFLRRLDFDKKKDIALDGILLIVSLAGLFALAIFNVISALAFDTDASPSKKPFNDKDGAPFRLTLAIALLQIIEAGMQTACILDGLRRRPGPRVSNSVKWDRQCITFLLVCNVSLWILSTFEVWCPQTSPVSLLLYHGVGWCIISHISMPMVIFFRFHSAACMFEIWRGAFTDKPANTESSKTSP